MRELRAEHPASNGSWLLNPVGVHDRCCLTDKACGRLVVCDAGNIVKNQEDSNSQACSEVLGTAVVLSRPTMFSRIVQA